MRVTIDMEMKGGDRIAIEDKMSAAMGRYVEGLNSTDFATWTPETWARFVSTAFDVCAIEVFSRRVHVAGPWHTDDTPF